MIYVSPLTYYYRTHEYEVRSAPVIKARLTLVSKPLTVEDFPSYVVNRVAPKNKPYYRQFEKRGKW